MNRPSAGRSDSFTTQLGWVVQDFGKCRDFFQDIYRIHRFFAAENIDGRSVDIRYFGRAVDCTIHIYVGYAGDTQYEFIQPVSGDNIYRDFLEHNGGDGIQHIGHLMPAAHFETAVHRLRSAGYAEMQTMTFEISKVVYFDTRKAIGTVTEIVGFNESGMLWDKALKAGEF